MARMNDMRAIPYLLPGVITPVRSFLRRHDGDENGQAADGSQAPAWICRLMRHSGECLSSPILGMLSSGAGD